MTEANQVPQLEQVVQHASEIAVRVGIGSGMQHILRAARVIPEPGREHFLQSALVSTAEKLLWDESADTTTVLELLDPMDKSVDLGNSLAETGKWLSREDKFRRRSHAVLARAAQVFECAYQTNFDASIEDRYRVLVEDYARVASLQDEALDSEGARQTSLMLAPHLLKVAEHRDELDKHSNISLDEELASTATAIGLQNPLAQQLLRSVANEKMKELHESIALERFCVGVMAGGSVETGMSMLVASHQADLGVSFWHSVLDVTREGNAELANNMVLQAQEYFPGVYTDATSVDAGMTPMVKALAELGKDMFIKDIFQSLVRQQEDIGSVERFAYACGEAGELGRLETILQQVAFNQEHRQKINRAYQLGAHSAQKPSAASDV